MKNLRFSLVSCIFLSIQRVSAMSDAFEYLCCTDCEKMLVGSEILLRDFVA